MKSWAQLSTWGIFHKLEYQALRILIIGKAFYTSIYRVVASFEELTVILFPVFCKYCTYYIDSIKASTYPESLIDIQIPNPMSLEACMQGMNFGNLLSANYLFYIKDLKEKVKGITNSISILLHLKKRVSFLFISKYVENNKNLSFPPFNFGAHFIQGTGVN